MIKITQEELFQRQIIVSLFVGFIITFYAIIMNVINVKYNVLTSLINFAVLISALFFSKTIVEKIYGIKFKNCIVE